MIVGNRPFGLAQDRLPALGNSKKFRIKGEEELRTNRFMSDSRSRGDFHFSTRMGHGGSRRKRGACSVRSWSERLPAYTWWAKNFFSTASTTLA